MPLPEVSLNILDGSLGLLPPSSAKTQIKFGVAPLGAVNAVQSMGDLATLLKTFGKGGDLVEAVALALAKGGPVLGVAVNPSTYGAPGAVTKTTVGAASTSTLAITAISSIGLKVKVVVGGILATAQVQFSTDGGATWSANVVTAATVMCTVAPFVTFAFSAGTYVVGDTWTVSTADGTVTFSGSGANGCTVSSASPVDAYAVRVAITTGGALGVAQFTYSLDGGNTVVGPLLVPASGKYSPPDTGLLFTFANAQVLTDAWSCTVTGASYNTTDLTNAWNAAVADARTWGFFHVVGPASTAAGAAAVLAAVDTLVEAAATSFRYARGIVEVPLDTDGNLLTAFGASNSKRVGAAAGFCYVTSPVNGRQQYRSVGRIVAARANQIAVSEDFGKVMTGAVSSAAFVPTNPALPTGRDEFASPGLDAGRFCTLRSIIGVNGIFVTSGRAMASPGSDYTFLQNGRVMDVACATTRAALLKYLNASVRVNSDGTIVEKDAQAIENDATQALRSALVQPGDASSARVTVSRSQNVLSSQTLVVSIRVVPLGYARTITVDIGFQSPATLN